MEVMAFNGNPRMKRKTALINTSALLNSSCNRLADTRSYSFTLTPISLKIIEITGVTGLQLLFENSGT